MSFDQQFVLASRALTLLGILALSFTGSIGIVYLALAFGAVVWTGWLGWQGRGQGLAPGIANATSAVAMVLIFAPVAFRGAPPISAIAEFLLVLTALRALAADDARDWMQVYALSFFEVVAASALTVEPSFAAVFAGYLLLAPWALVLLCLRGELVGHGLGERIGEAGFVDAALFRNVAGVTVVLFVSTLAVFVFFPRMGAGMFANPLSTGAGLSGFSDEVGLGDVTALKSDETIALRVMLGDRERVRGQSLYWRGAALDSFDGRRWRRGRQEINMLSRIRPGVFVTERRRSRNTLEQEIIIEPMENPTIFFLGEPVELKGPFRTAMIDDLGNLRTITPAGTRIRYQVLSQLTPRRDPPTPRSQELPPVDSRVPALARDIVADATTPAARADALMAWFRRGFRYTMEPGDPGDGDPLARFLFETREGHCEYFASSLAVMLRAVGIPSLVVNGYLGGEWNPYGDYLAVRQSDAHSWVEAWIEDRWVVLDPTPAAPPSADQSRLSDLQGLVDAWRMRWYRYVVNYTLDDQVGLAFSLRDSSRRLWRGVTGEYWQDLWERLRSERSAPRGGSLLVAALVVAVGALVWFGWRMRRRMTVVGGWPTEAYLSMLRRLERRGLRRRPSDTPDEFLQRVTPELDGDRELVEQVTALYQQARFSGRDLPAERVEVERLLARLDAGS